MALALLGGIGWWHRRRTLPALADGPPTHTATPSRCRARLVTAASWLPAAEEWPVKAGGSSPASASRSARRAQRAVPIPRQNVAITPPAATIRAYDRPCASVITKSATTAGEAISETGVANRSESVNTRAAADAAAAAAQLR
ncbi:hypothetical protein [Streptomyces milbemycinicus]|uniref:hypothetical protein n=1 Tax=Streptomyces milbemycinicus TaxID=476552 RepID=UPI0033F508E5